MNWLDLNSDFFEHEFERQRALGKGLVASPYDVPRGILAYWDPHGEDLVVQFGYVSGKEPTEPIRIEDCTDKRGTVELGKRSNRLYRIRIPKENLDERVISSPSILVLELRDEIESLMSRSRSNAAHLNYSMAKMAVQENQQTLAKRLAEGKD